LEAVWRVGSMEGCVLTPVLKGDLKKANDWKNLKLLLTKELGCARGTAFDENRVRHGGSRRLLRRERLWLTDELKSGLEEAEDWKSVLSPVEYDSLRKNAFAANLARNAPRAASRRRSLSVDDAAVRGAGAGEGSSAGSDSGSDSDSDSDSDDDDDAEAEGYRVRTPIAARREWGVNSRHNARSSRAKSTGSSRVGHYRQVLTSWNSSDRHAPGVVEGGRRRCKSLPARVVGEVCELCKPIIDRLVQLCEKDNAMLSATERKHAKNKERKWSLQKLKKPLAAHAFDIDGCFAVHAYCLAAGFNVSSDYCTDLHRRTIIDRDLPTEQMSKEVVLGSDALMSRAIVPTE
jgi:hypothetical protein